MKFNNPSLFATLIIYGVCDHLLGSSGGAKARHAAEQRTQVKLFSKRGGVEVIPIPAGKFIMGGDDDFAKDRRHKVYLDAYVIGKTPVTVGQFREYCTASKIDFSSFKTPYWGWTDDNPMVNVTWQQARDFCKWAGGDLPTEAQWEKAARGTDGRMYPWGNKWDGSRLQWSSDHRATSAKRTASVTAHPTGASPYGCLDMAGNVYQWCLDRYGPITSSAQTRNPTGPTTGLGRILRGGSWDIPDPAFFRCLRRETVTPTTLDDRFGFRFCGPAEAGP